DAADSAVVGPLLRPVEMAARGVDGDTDAPSGRVTAIAVAVAGLHEHLDVGPVEVCAHHAHPLAIGPIELVVLAIELQLLRGEGAAFGHDRPAIRAVEIGALDRAVVAARHAHIGPVDVSAFRIHRDTVWIPAAGHERLRAAGAIRTERQHPAA